MELRETFEQPFYSRAPWFEFIRKYGNTMFMDSIGWVKQNNKEQRIALEVFDATSEAAKQIGGHKAVESCLEKYGNFTKVDAAVATAGYYYYLYNESQKKEGKQLTFRFYPNQRSSFVTYFLDELTNAELVWLSKIGMKKLSTAAEEDKEQILHYRTRSIFGNNEQDMLSATLIEFLVQLAITGDRTCRKALLTVYKRHYKQEYKILKRFQDIGLEDFIPMIHDCPYEDETPLVARASRIIVMSTCMQIELKINMHVISESIIDAIDEMDAQGLISRTCIVNEYDAAGRSLIDEETLVKEHKDMIGRLLYVAAGTLEQNYINHNTIPFYINEVVNKEKVLIPEEDMIVDMGMNKSVVQQFFKDMRTKFHTKPLHLYSAEEQAAALTLYTCLSYVTDSILATQIMTRQILGLPMAEVEEKRDAELEAIYNEDIVKKAEGKKQEVEATYDRFNEELERKDKELLAKEREIVKLRNEATQAFREFNSLLAENERLEEVISNLEAEIKSLKDPYPISDNNLKEAPAAKISHEEMRKKLNERKVVLIGGNQNWIKRFQTDVFPNWMFIPPNMVNLSLDTINSTLDAVVFFTDTLDHTTYYRFTAAAREKKVKTYYLHGLNEKRVVADLYHQIFEM